MTAGRKSTMTPEVIGKLEQAFAIGCSDVEAMVFAGVKKDAFYDYQAAHPEFAERKEMLRETLILKARVVVHDAIDKKKDSEMAKWYLERKKKDEFSTKSELGLGGLAEGTYDISLKFDRPKYEGQLDPTQEKNQP